MMISSSKVGLLRPRLLMAYADSINAARTSRQFRRQGWEVHLVHSSADARRLANSLRPELVLLDADLPDESGWLTCAKLSSEARNLRVYIIGDVRRLDSHAFAEFVGAAGFIRRDQPQLPALDDQQNIAIAV